jgi:hypothetical protein
MKIKHVVSAIDNNPKYTRFVPIFVKCWKHFYPDINITILYISNSKVSDEFAAYCDYIKQINVPPHMQSAYVAQVIRLLWPALVNESEAVVITDIDNIPGNKYYFNIDFQETFTSMRPNHVVADRQISMMFCVASSKVWADIFNIYSESDIYSFLYTNYNEIYDGHHGGLGWYSDQEIVYKYVIAWEKRTGKKVKFLNDSETKFNRLNNNIFQYNKSILIPNIKTEAFSDVHIYANQCPWTMKEMEEMADVICGSS